MFELFQMGGPLFMGIITLVLLAALVLSLMTGLSVRQGANPERTVRNIELIKSIGLLALVIGVLGQFIGLFSAFQAMEQFSEGISPALLAGGLKVSSITTIWGLMSYAITLVVALGLRSFAKV